VSAVHPHRDVPTPLDTSAIGERSVPTPVDTGAIGKDASLPTPTALRCMLCGDVIGVYEPLVLCRGSEPLITSLASDPTLDSADAHYHHDCYNTVEQSG
jgi:hypothetical protein